MPRQPLSEKKIEHKQLKERREAQEHVHITNREILSYSEKALTNLKNIEGYAKSYEVLFVLNWEEYALLEQGKNPAIITFLNRFAENRISSREEHSLLEYHVRMLCNSFKHHPMFSGARGQLPSGFIELFNRQVTNRIREISDVWETRPILEKFFQEVLVRWVNSIGGKFMNWLVEENEKTNGHVDVRNFPKHDPTEDINKIAGALEFPDLVLTEVSVGFGKMKLVDFYGIKQAIEVMSSVVGAHERSRFGANIL